MTTYCVYIMTNQHNTVLYTGVTNDLAKRVWQHRHGQGGAFTRKYRVTKLVYCARTRISRRRSIERSRSKADRERKSGCW